MSIILCQLAGFIGSFFTRMSVSTWYPTLIKPQLAPPAWIFAPVWITLFTLMGISLYLIINMKPESIFYFKKAISIFAIQLLLNVLWSAAFFGLHSPLSGLIVIIFLWLLILFNIIEFYKISKTAGILLIPYILWVSFAAYLNLGYWRLN